MGIARLHRKRHNFSIIDNQAAEDKTLSWKARGILWYLLTKPDNWKVRISDLVAKSDKDGRDSVKAGFKELEQAGYAIRNRTRNEQGQFEWVTEVFETKEDAAKWLKLRNKADFHHSGFSVDGFSVDGKPVDIVNTDSDITDPGITEFNQAINQADKAFSQNAVHAANFGKRDTAKKQEQPNTPKTMPTVNQPSAVGGINPRQDNYSANFSKKEKQAKVAFRHDRYGVLQFPAAKKYKLPSILAMRSMQFLLAKELECEFAVDADGAVWVCDPKMGDWLSEEEMFGGGSDHEQGHLSLKKMVSILNGDTAPSQLDIDWFNKTAKWYFHFWHGHCQQLGENAPSVIGQQSVGLWLQQLDADFGIELADLDEVA